MQEREKVLQANKLLAQIRMAGEKLAIIAQKNDATVELWEVAQKQQDGVEELRHREIIHSLLDQSLDARAEVLHLVKKFQSL